ncbi:MAG: hypothetical protein BGO12_03380 [Verrucomicrobia bacterium 61-8]|nr:hypothetical protein [Verrucomicrobiota bacterium]OJV22735.1 MAG: hypothetical protein BGO12_03380 [Verrucomicrobia bacterium 61-8]
MKSPLILLALLLFPALIFAEDIPPEAAGKHVGKHGTVSGILIEVAENNGNYFLNFGKHHPQQVFQGFVPASSAEAVNQKTELKQLEGRQVEISGRIELHKGCPEIVITKASQIRISRE